MSEYTYNETVIEHEISQDYYCISTGERTWKNRLKRLALYHPDACVVIAENGDGSVCYHVPKSWIKISPPRHVVMTDEQKRKTAERLKAAREQMAQNETDSAEQIIQNVTCSDDDADHAEGR